MILRRTLEAAYVRNKIDESENLSEQAITFNLLQQNKCLFLSQDYPKNYSQSEVLQALEKSKLKKV